MNYRKIMKENLGCATLALVLGFGAYKSCAVYEKNAANIQVEYFLNAPEANGADVKIVRNPLMVTKKGEVYTLVTIGTVSNDNIEGDVTCFGTPCVIANDLEGDGLYDKLDVSNVPTNSPLRRFDSFQSISDLVKTLEAKK